MFAETWSFITQFSVSRYSRLELSANLRTLKVLSFSLFYAFIYTSSDSTRVIGWLASSSYFVTIYFVDAFVMFFKEGAEDKLSAAGCSKTTKLPPTGCID